MSVNGHGDFAMRCEPCELCADVVVTRVGLSAGYTVGSLKCVLSSFETESHLPPADSLPASSVIDVFTLHYRTKVYRTYV